MNEINKNLKKEETMKEQDFNKIIQENQFLKEREQLYNLRESLREDTQFRMMLIERVEAQNQLTIKVIESLQILTDKLREGLNSLNQQLYNLSLAIDTSNSTINEQQAEPRGDEAVVHYENVNSENEKDEQEQMYDDEEEPENNYSDYDEEKVEESIKDLEKRRMELKKQALKNHKMKEKEQELIQKAIMEDKRVEARAKIKAEEILTKKEVEAQKNRVKDVPDEVIKEFEEKYGRF